MGVVNIALLTPVETQVLHLLLADTLWIVWIVFGASVIAAEEGAVWALDQEEFLATVTGQPQAERAAHAISAERLRGLAQRDEPSA